MLDLIWEDGFCVVETMKTLWEVDDGVGLELWWAKTKGIEDIVTAIESQRWEGRSRY